MRTEKEAIVMVRVFSTTLLTIVAQAALLLILAGTAQAAVDPPAILDNGTIRLGVSPEGNLGAPGGPPSPSNGTTNVGLRFLPTGNESVSHGGAQEGWGVADAASGTTGFASGTEYFGDANVTVVDFATTGTTATSVVDIGGAPSFRVTHSYKPSAISPNFFEATVRIENTGTSPAEDVRYRRVVDWDVEPTPFDEFVTIGGENIPALLFSSNEGFASPDALGRRENYGATGFFTDFGPDDQGALFDFGLGSLQPGEAKSFKLFYGAAANEANALGALDDAGTDAYSLSQPATQDGSALGTPNTFVLGFLVTNRPPTAEDDATQTDEGKPVTFDILGNDTDPNGDTLTVAGFDQPQNGTVDCTDDGQCTYTPNANFDGADSFTYSATDGTDESNPATVTIMVKAGNKPPDTAITSGPSDLTNNTSPSFSWTGSDIETATAGLLYSYKLDANGSWSAYSSATSVTLSNIAPGNHTFYVKAKDGGNREDPSPAERSFTVDTTAPTVTGKTPPAAATGVPRNTNVVVTFSENMNSDTVTTSTFTLIKQGTTTPILATVTYDPVGKKATLDPSSNLASNTTYIVTVKGGSAGMQDVAGNLLANDATWSFTTADTMAPSPPTIDLDAASDAGVSNTDNLTNDTTPTLSGNAEANSTVKVYDGGGTAPIGATTANASGTWSFTPTSAVADGAHQLTATATDSANNPSSESATLVVTIDTVRPNVDTFTPLLGLNTVAATTNAEAVVSEAMNAGSINTSTFTVVRAGAATPITAGVTYDGATKKAVLDPSSNLVAGATYNATVKTGAQDLAGNALAADKMWSFSVNSAPTIAIVSPNSGASITDRTPNIRATVKDAQTDLAKSNVRFFLDGVEKTNFTYDVATDRLSWIPGSRLSLGKHTVKVIGKDPQGLSTTKSWSFTVK